MTQVIGPLPPVQDPWIEFLAPSVSLGPVTATADI